MHKMRRRAVEIVKIVEIAGVAAASAVIPLCGGGCGWMRVAYAPELGSRNRIIQTVHADTATAAMVAAETSIVVVEGPATEPPRKQVKVPNSHLEDGPPSITAPAYPDSGDEAGAPFPDTAPPSVSVALAPAEKAKLTATTRFEMAEADSIVVKVGPRLYREKDREKLQTVQGLIDQARSALDREDVRAAANLAHKARVLALELGGK